jgi:hypothetical protein
VKPSCGTAFFRRLNGGLPRRGDIRKGSLVIPRKSGKKGSYFLFNMP